MKRADRAQPCRLPRLRLIFGALALLGAPVGAQIRITPPPSSDSSTTTSRYDPFGIRYGVFTIYPSLRLTGTYDDNIFDRPQRVNDLFVALHPELVVRSNEDRYRLDVNVNGTITRFASVTSQNTEQFSGRADGAVDVTRTLQLTGTGQYAREIEPRGTSGDIFNGGEPIAYYRTFATIGAQQQLGRFRFNLAATLNRYNYDDTRLASETLTLGSRNYQNRAGSLRVGYEIGPSLVAFVSGSVNRSTYHRIPEGGLDRNSSGFAVLGGVGFGLTDLLNGEIGLGYIRQNFRDARFPDVSGLNYSAALHWRPTPLVTINGTVARSIERTLFLNAAGIIETTANLTVDYEVRRNWMLRLTGTYTDSIFRGFDRRDHRLSGGATVRYLINEYLALSLGADHRRQRSAGSFGREYDGSSVRLGITAQL